MFELKPKTKIQIGLDEVIGPALFYRFEGIGDVGSYGPVATSDAGFEEETVFEERELVACVEIEI